MDIIPNPKQNIHLQIRVILVLDNKWTYTFMKCVILRLFSLCRTQISIISLLYWHVTQLLLHDIQFCDYAFYIT
jgi:hypothetical protein